MTNSRALGVLIAFVVAADWISKFWVRNHLSLGETVSVVGGWIWFSHHLNRGVAFSLFADMPAMWRDPLLVGLAVVALSLLARMLRTTRNRVAGAAGALIFAGALGNLGDRLADGAVTDWILVRSFPAVFNLADAAITLGAVVLAVCLVRSEDDPFLTHS